MTNSAAIGYMILAMMKLGYDIEQIKTMESEMARQMDFKNEFEAINAYNNF